MSYCRIGEEGSDVYMFGDGVQWFIDTKDEAFKLDTIEDAKRTLTELQARGLHVPERTLTRVNREIEDPVAARTEQDQRFLREIEQALAAEGVELPSKK